MAAGNLEAASQAPETVISVDSVSKTFSIPRERHTSLKQHALSLFRTGGYHRFDALHDVSLEVRRGEFFSIVGQNGSGKSTLLKVLAGIYRPTSGQMTVAGRLSPFIELGVGFNPDLTARENIYLNGAILGLERREVEDVFDQIIQFAELSEFVEQKLKNYSSGMLVRLAFAVAIQAHADILLIDEVLAVGDANFQQKCFDVFRRFKAEGRTIVFVSHDMGSIREFSDRVLVLNRGRVHGIFTPGVAVTEYSQLNSERANEAMTKAEDHTPRARQSSPQILDVRILDRERQPTHVVERGGTMIVAIRIQNRERLPINLGVAIKRNDDLYVFGTNTLNCAFAIPVQDEVEVEVEYSLVQLQQGSYNVTVGLNGEQISTCYDMRERDQEFRVTQEDAYEGMMYLDHRWRSAPRG